MVVIMNVGKLRHKIIIQQQSTTQDAAGQELETWTTFNTVWAKVIPLIPGSREHFEAQQEHVEVNTKINIRHLAGITPKMRVLWGTRIYDIKYAIDINERSKETVIMCEELIA